jgi:hypothetical protein
MVVRYPEYEDCAAISLAGIRTNTETIFIAAPQKMGCTGINN